MQRVTTRQHRVTIVLASASPQRRTLLTQLDVPFEAVGSPYAEPSSKPDNTSASAWAVALAHFKARSVADARPRQWTLGADTVVDCAGRLLGKPANADDARAMLQLQAGARSTVITGLCLCRTTDRTVNNVESGPVGIERYLTAVSTTVWMRDDPLLIEQYIETGDWAGKAGAYGIQTVGDALVERIDGSFSNVVGLPLEVLRDLFARVGIPTASPP